MRGWGKSKISFRLSWMSSMHKGEVKKQKSNVIRSSKISQKVFLLSKSSSDLSLAKRRIVIVHSNGSPHLENHHQQQNSLKWVSQTDSKVFFFLLHFVSDQFFLSLFIIFLFVTCKSHFCIY